MKTIDAVRSLGTMCGIGLSYVALRAIGVESHWVRVLIAVVLGFGFGLLCEHAYRAWLSRPPRR